MNGVIEAIVVALVPIAVLNTGLLIYFCGTVKSDLRNLDLRIERLEDWRDEREPRHRFAGEGS